MQNCDTCAYLKKPEQECRRRAPQPITEAHNRSVYWPLIPSPGSDWCGEFSRGLPTREFPEDYEVN